MRTVISVITLVVATATLSAGDVSFAGHRENNGGGALKCEGQSMQVLDIWEGKVAQGLTFDESIDLDATLKKGITALFKAADRNFALRVETLFGHMRMGIFKAQYLAPGLQIAPPADARNGLMAEGCTLVGVALMNDLTSILTIDQRYTKEMSGFQYGALLLHELIYKVQREFYLVENSVSARRMTACVLSEQGCVEADRAQIDPESKLICSNGVVEFEFDQRKTIYPTLRFTRYRGRALPVPSYLDTRINSDISHVRLAQNGRLTSMTTLPVFYAAPSSSIGLDFTIAMEFRGPDDLDPSSKHLREWYIDDRPVLCHK